MHYDPETGVFTRKIARRASKARSVGTVHSAGYLRIVVDYKFYYAHRLAWLYMRGVWPKRIDHVNGVKLDNRICNLREATQSQNGANSVGRGKYKKGVTRLKNGKFQAGIMVQYKHIHLGHHNTEDEAHAAYARAAKEYFGEFASTRRKHES